MIRIVVIDLSEDGVLYWSGIASIPPVEGVPIEVIFDAEHGLPQKVFRPVAMHYVDLYGLPVYAAGNGMSGELEQE